MLILGIETSCDETAAALVEDGTILSNIISSQIDLHASFGGVSLRWLPKACGGHRLCHQGGLRLCP